MEPTAKQLIGQKGEQIAADYLLKNGFTVLDRNYRRKWGELDIIAKKGNLIHFVEVKTVTREIFLPEDYEPEDNIHPRKLKRLGRAIETYLLEKGLDEEDWQLDALSVYLDKDEKLLKIDLIEDIF